MFRRRQQGIDRGNKRMIVFTAKGNTETKEKENTTMSTKAKHQPSSVVKDYTKMKTPHTYAIIFTAVILCWILTFLIPAGKFSTHSIEYADSNGATKTKTVLMADTFRYSYHLDTASVRTNLEQLMADEALMDTLEVDSEALKEFLATDPATWSQEDLDDLGLTDDVLYEQYGEAI